jgi:ankyrin repeat protein
MTNESLDRQRFTVLHLIILQLQPWDLERALEDCLYDIDAVDINGRTTLLWAAWKGDIQNVRLLLEYGADPNVTDIEWWTPLAKACEAGHLDVTQALLDVAASPSIANREGSQPVHHASAHQSAAAAIIQRSLDYGADLSARTKSGQTPLHIAAENGNPDTVKRLLAGSTDRDMIDDNGDTPLMLVARSNKSPAI